MANAFKNSSKGPKPLTGGSTNAFGINPEATMEAAEGGGTPKPPEGTFIFKLTGTPGVVEGNPQFGGNGVGWTWEIAAAADPSQKAEVGKEYLYQSFKHGQMQNGRLSPDGRRMKHFVQAFTPEREWGKLDVKAAGEAYSECLDAFAAGEYEGRCLVATVKKGKTKNGEGEWTDYEDVAPVSADDPALAAG